MPPAGVYPDKRGRRDLSRLLRPRSVAVFGGVWAAKVVEECARFGFGGAVWPVHPAREAVGGVRAYLSVADLPGVPDVAFVGVNREATVEVVRNLAARGAGGAVLFASGFAEAGASDLQYAVLAAAGEMPVLGPNCYGFVNALEGAVIWPDQQGCARVERGVAVISQSSNIAITLTMQRRGLPLAYVACLGNAAQVGLSDLAAALLADNRVTALGVYAEALDTGFAEVVAAARASCKGVVVLKAGRSEAGRRAAVSHTAALAGDRAVASALLAQAGAGEVATVPELIEALKVLHFTGPLEAPRLISVSCSGGEAGLMADATEAAGLDFPPVPEPEARRLEALLGPRVTVANPLDYQTYIWGDGAAMAEIFTAAVAGFDAGLFVLDPPRGDRCSDASYEPAYAALGAARAQTGKPVFAVATLPDTIGEEFAARLTGAGVVPLLGVAEALAAIRAASAPGPRASWAPWAAAAADEGRVLDEASAKALLAAAGVAVPRGVTAVSLAALETAGLVPPFALKGLGPVHKSDAGAVRLGVTEPAGEAEMQGVSGYFLEEMVPGGVAELLVGLRRDPVAGVAVTLGAGGVTAELLADTVTLIAPVTAGEVVAALQRLRLWPVLDGYRGRARSDVRAVVAAVLAVQGMMAADPALIEVEINPLIVQEQGAVAVDALIRRNG